MARVRGAAEQVVIGVPPDAVYAAVSDVAAMGRWSPVNTGATVPTPHPLRPGDVFVGHNRSGRVRWSTRCRVLAADPGEVFAFEVSVPGVPIARWHYRLRPVDGGTEVTESWQDLRRGPLGTAMYGLTRMAMRTGDPAESTRRNLRRTLERLKADLEGARTD